jgi:hypothetical protein
VWLRYASWDLARVYLADPKTGVILSRIYPVDKTKNAEGRRAPRDGAPVAQAPLASPGIAPLLQKIIHQYATTGLPPAFLPDRQSDSAQPTTPTTPSLINDCLISIALSLIPSLLRLRPPPCGPRPKSKAFAGALNSRLAKAVLR